jgi:hypothetical protein
VQVRQQLVIHCCMLAAPAATAAAACLAACLLTLHSSRAVNQSCHLSSSRAGSSWCTANPHCGPRR